MNLMWYHTCTYISLIHSHLLNLDIILNVMADVINLLFLVCNWSSRYCFFVFSKFICLQSIFWRTSPNWKSSTFVSRSWSYWESFIRSVDLFSRLLSILLLFSFSLNLLKLFLISFIPGLTLFRKSRFVLTILALGNGGYDIGRYPHPVFLLLDRAFGLDLLLRLTFKDALNLSDFWSCYILWVIRFVMMYRELLLCSFLWFTWDDVLL